MRQWRKQFSAIFVMKGEKTILPEKILSEKKIPVVMGKELENAIIKGRRTIIDLRGRKTAINSKGAKAESEKKRKSVEHFENKKCRRKLSFT